MKEGDEVYFFDNSFTRDRSGKYVINQFYFKYKNYGEYEITEIELADLYDATKPSIFIEPHEGKLFSLETVWCCEKCGNVNMYANTSVHMTTKELGEESCDSRYYCSECDEEVRVTTLDMFDKDLKNEDY
jgi:hypothetical protein